MSETVTIVAVVDRSAGLREVTASNNPLDVSIACKTLYERLREASLKLGARLILVDSPRDAYPQLKTEGVTLLVDALGGFLDHYTAFKRALEAYVEAPSETIAFVSKPYTIRGVHVTVRGSSISDVGEGRDVFTGLLVAKTNIIHKLLHASNSIEDVLRAANPQARYWPEPWLRLEEGFDILLYNLLYLERLKESRVSTRASLSPTSILEGPVIIEDGARLDHYSVVKGPAVVCRGAFIGLHAVVRPFSTLEPGSRIGAYSEVYVTSLQRRASTSSHTYITGSVIGENAHVEPFSVTRVVYGHEAAKRLGVVAPYTPEIRAGSVVRSGRRIKAGSVVDPLTII